MSVDQRNHLPNRGHRVRPGMFIIAVNETLKSVHQELMAVIFVWIISIIRIHAGKQSAENIDKPGALLIV